MAIVRVLIVDDSAFYRRVLSDALNADAEIEVVGTAQNGRVALERIPDVRPDVVVLDSEMPEMNGLEMLAALRRTHRKLPVVMFSSLTQEGAQTTIDALLLGANDYVTKPGVSDRIERMNELVRKVKMLAGISGEGGAAGSSRTLPPGLSALRVRYEPPHAAGAAAAAAQRSASPGAPLRRPDAIAIGSSTGGPNALASLFSTLPGDLNVPIVVVQHMPPVFTRALADRLSGVSPIKCFECSEDMEVKPGQAYIAPGDFHMRVRRIGTKIVLRLDRDPPENSCRPAVDVTFRTAADVWGTGLLALVLTGMGQDGCRGGRRIIECGGRIWAQDEASSVVWGMPGAVVKAGLAQRVLPLSQIGPELVRTVRAGTGANAATEARPS